MSKAIAQTKTVRRQVDAVAEVLRPWGLKWELHAGHHPVILVSGPKGGVWRLAIASTPKDADAAEQNARQKARCLVREINARLGL